MHILIAAVLGANLAPSDALNTKGMDVSNGSISLGYVPMDGKAPFGTVVQQWSWGTSYVGAGVTFVRDSGLFYLCNQSTNYVYSFNPTSGAFTQLFATGCSALAWGLHFDDGDGTFWITDIDGSSTAILRQYDGNGVATGKTFNLFTETGHSGWWCSGDYDPSTGETWIPNVGGTNQIDKFDLTQAAGSTYLGQVTNPNNYSLRGFGFLHHLPNDGTANSMIVDNWYDPIFGEATLAGVWIQSINPGQSYAGSDVWEPLGLTVADSIYDFVISNASPDVMYKVALGYSWGDLDTYIQEKDERALYDVNVATLSRGGITLSYSVPKPVDMKVAVFDGAGRVVDKTESNVSGTGHMNLSTGHGVYFVTVSAGVYEEVFKVVVD